MTCSVDEMAAMNSDSTSLQPAKLSDSELATASYIQFADEMERWVDSVLEQLGWTRQDLEVGQIFRVTV